MRTPTRREVATELQFREEQRARRQPKEAQIVPEVTDHATRQKARYVRRKKTEQRKTVEEERQVAAAIHLKYRILDRKQEVARIEPKEAEEMFQEDLELISAIIPGLKDEPENDVYLAEFHRLQEKYGKAG